MERSCRRDGAVRLGHAASLLLAYGYGKPVQSHFAAYFLHPNIRPDVELGSNHMGLMVEPQPRN
jgi:hypothetical protein